MAQMDPILENKESNLKKMQSWIERATREESDLIVFPEMSLTGYSLRDHVFALSESIPGDSVKKLERIAVENNLHVIFGMPEMSDKLKGVIYNSAVLIGPQGYIGKYRKQFLPTHGPFEELRYFRPGPVPEVFETSIGSIGLQICFDAFLPEVSRFLAVEGADILVNISAAPAIGKAYSRWGRASFETVIPARAMENTVFFVYVNLVGIENNVLFCGGSEIAAPNGEQIAKAKYDAEDFLTVKLDLSKIEKTRRSFTFLTHIRPELYDRIADRIRKI
ncbi:MAG: carbon-nitrogen hydrolase family protein [Promethearchaeota archaeon]